MLKKIFSLLLFILLLFAGIMYSASLARGADQNASNVYIAPLTGIVGVQMEDHVKNVLSDIGRSENAILILRMDTPGGLVDSMSRIMTSISEAEIPVVVWVGPSGARAASAGAFIIQAAHVSAMAPGTNIGAAHPVTGSGGDIDNKEMDKKVVNDLTAKMRAFAQERGHNVAVVESMVRESVSLTAREAFEQYVIDMLATDERELIEKLDGRVVKIKGSDVTISLGSYEIKRIEMDFRQRALEFFSRPEIAYLALIAGIFLIVLELKSPGGFVMGVTGGILLLIAAYALQVLPVNITGVLLLAGGVIVIIADVMVGGIGILALAGLGAMLAGGLMMYRAPGAEFLHISAGFIFGVTFAAGAIFFLILRLIVKALKRKPSSGMEGLIGERARIMSPADGDGARLMALIHGEYWRVSYEEGANAASPGDEVEVVAVESMTLRVRPIKSEIESQ
ncbi:MAG: nodulation protein NfeD [Synergistaceae bacterium]|jgi:membrane-bound serine protease (ClpP class)|nr:nodulation protein NfeD [Synergistaceae bacterium]